MKTKTRIFALLLSVAGLAVLLLSCTYYVFVGNRVKDQASYLLDIERMTGTDRHTLTLKEGDVLQIGFQTEKGSLHLEVKAPNGVTVYEGNGKETTEFTLTVPVDGDYTVYVEARRAKGKIRIRLKGTDL